MREIEAESHKMAAPILGMFMPFKLVDSNRNPWLEWSSHQATPNNFVKFPRMKTMDVEWVYIEIMSLR
jgi:hypothetical protein